MNMNKETGNTNYRNDSVSRDDIDKRIIKMNKIPGHSFSKEHAAISVFDPWTAGNNKLLVKTKEDYEKNLIRYEVSPIVFACANIRAMFSIGVGFTVECEDKKIEEFIITELERLGINFATKSVSDDFLNISRHLDIYGNEYMEMIWDKDGNIVDLRSLNPTRVTPVLSKKTGELLYYKYRKNKSLLEKEEYVNLSPDKIMHFKENNVEDSPIGMSKIKPVLREIDSSIQISDMGVLIAKSYIKPWMHIKYDPRENEPPTSVAFNVEKMREFLMEAQPNSDLVTSTSWSMDPISPPVKIEQLIKYIEFIDERVMQVFEVPDSFFRASGTTDMRTQQQVHNFIMTCKSRQNYIAYILENQLFKKMIENGLGITNPTEEQIPTIVWEVYLSRDFYKAAQASAKLFKEGVLSRDEARHVLGIDSSDPTLEEEIKKEVEEEKPEEEMEENPKDKIGTE